MKQRPLGHSNPFASTQSDAIRDALASRIDDVEPSLVWACRARSLAYAIAPALAWAHETTNLELTPDRVAAFLRFDNLVALASNEAVDGAAEASLSDRAEMPDLLRLQLAGYLAELPGFNSGATIPSESAARVTHSYVQYVLCRSFQ